MLGAPLLRALLGAFLVTTSVHKLLECLLLKLASPVCVLGAMVLEPLELAVIKLDGLLEAAKLAVVELQPPQHLLRDGGR